MSTRLNSTTVSQSGGGGGGGGQEPQQECFAIATYMVIINDWTRYLSCQLLFGSIYMVICLVGVIGNASLIKDISQRKRLRMVPNIFLINLSFSDLLLSIIAVPIAPVTFVRKEWYLGQFLCRLLPFCQGVTVLISSFNLICIAFDRYRNISKISAVPWSARHALVITVLAWVLALVCNSPLYINTNLDRIPSSNVTMFCGRFCGEFGWAKDSRAKKLFGTIMLHIQFILPVLFMILCYSGVWNKIRRDMLISSVAGEFQRVRAARRKTRVLTALILMIMAFVISWLPLTIVNILRDYDIPLKLLDRQPYFSQLIIHSVAMSSVMWNPLLYFWMNYIDRNSARSRSAHSEFETIGTFRFNRTSQQGSTYLLPKTSIVSKFSHQQNSPYQLHPNQQQRLRGQLHNSVAGVNCTTETMNRNGTPYNNNLMLPPKKMSSVLPYGNNDESTMLSGGGFHSAELPRRRFGFTATRRRSPRTSCLIRSINASIGRSVNDPLDGRRRKTSSRFDVTSAHTPSFEEQVAMADNDDQMRTPVKKSKNKNAESYQLLRINQNHIQRRKFSSQSPSKSIIKPAHHQRQRESGGGISPTMMPTLVRSCHRLPTIKTPASVSFDDETCQKSDLEEKKYPTHRSMMSSKRSENVSVELLSPTNRQTFRLTDNLICDPCSTTSNRESPSKDDCCLRRVSS